MDTSIPAPRSRPRRSTRAWIALPALAVLLLAGCGASWNKGGDTTCDAFMKLNTDRRSTVIRTFLMEGGGREPNSFEIAAARTTVQVFCSTVGRPGDPIRGG